MANQSRILIVEDDASYRDFLAMLLRQEGYSVDCAIHGAEAEEKLQESTYDVLMTDIFMPEVDGMQLLDFVKARRLNTEAILITGRPNVSDAVEAMKTGACDYIVKASPDYDIDRVLDTISNVLNSRKSSKDVLGDHSGIVGKSEPMRELFEMMGKVCDSDSTVLIMGESGTGKELISRSLHDTSARKNYPFITVNCAAIQETLLESELFGHEKGAFTGATQQKPGLFQLADKGTLFLDEISEMSFPLQAKLLRAIESGTFRAVGCVSDVEVDARIIAATNVDLKEAVKKKLFREDLFYRLNVFPINVPPLRERKGDIPLLMEHFLDKHGGSGDGWQVSPRALEAIEAYHWPGNVRELENLTRRVVILNDKKHIEVEDLPQEIQNVDAGSAADPLLTLKEAKKKFERKYIERLLKETNGNISDAAQLASISRTYFYEVMSKHGVSHHVYQTTNS